ncbi:hypothetical protein [Streptomyces sp. AMCC400023]|uniref:hypothetical protein n=1 Tax=Streptomyces sp. AMCC400023 TaxID=2056258 RepID=UPI001F441AE2|nr:hypothetical protein [Streptomyces sp. AMCC400023]UJV42071.1 hypothetical protein CVT30_21455 [Streptomyces sp. AMCC400023]
MRHTTTLLTAACLALASCSGNTEPAKPSPSATQSPTISDADARQTCVDAWHALMTADDYDPDAEPKTPGACDGLTGQAAMYAEALAERNAENRERLDECLDDPTCTKFPVG